MFPAILLFCCIGIYSINNNPGDVLTAFSACSAMLLIKFGFEPAPLLLGFVLGRLMEEAAPSRAAAASSRRCCWWP
jgi:putative tricarboxylic transport membrane protein